MPSSDTQFKKGNTIGHKGKPPVPFDTGPMLKVVEELAARGCRQTDIARACGVSAETFLRLLREDAALKNAHDAGRGQMHDALIGRLYQQAMTSPNPACLIYACKVLLGYRENDVPQESRPIINITLPGALPMEKFVALEGKLAKALPPTLAKELVRG